jgi:hypothetical protein
LFLPFEDDEGDISPLEEVGYGEPSRPRPHNAHHRIPLFMSSTKARTQSNHPSIDRPEACGEIATRAGMRNQSARPRLAHSPYARAALRLLVEFEPSELRHLVGAFECGERDRQVLDREAG